MYNLASALPSSAVRMLARDGITSLITVAELSCAPPFPHNDPMHGFVLRMSGYNITPAKMLCMCVYKLGGSM